MTIRSANKVNENKWYKLDNAAKIYPAISRGSGGSVFRVAVQLTSEVHPETLQKALEDILPRFPTMAVRMHRGLFWYYFDANPKEPMVFQEEAPPCRPIRIEENNGFLFRVCYYQKRIALEVFHALTDGTGAMAFLKALTFHYLQLTGAKLSSDDTILHNQMLPKAEETEDSFKKYYDNRMKCRWTEDKAYQVQGTRMPRGYVGIVHGIVPVKNMLELARGAGATVTEYITALMIYAIYNTQLKKRNCPLPVKISVPVNLRNFFPSQTLRNFSSYVNVGMRFTKEDWTFEQVLENVVKTLRSEVQPDKLIAKLSANVKAETNVFMRIVPLFIKDIVLKSAFNAYGESLFSSTLSNLGAVKLPESMARYVERFEFVLGPPVLNMFNCTICSFRDEMILTFTKAMHETDIERFFFRFLAEKGLDITIETN
jgi:hypothetical protein